MSKNDYLIRLERKEDYPVVENLIREAFWNVYRPRCMEHYLITRLREHPDFVKELDFVMEKDGEIIGQNVFVKANIKADDGRNIPILTMGPICITPELKRHGYGKILLDYSIAKATELGFGAVCFEGNINFYGKSGFTFASEFGLRYHGLPEGADASFFLCKELIPGYLSGISEVERFLSEKKDKETITEKQQDSIRCYYRKKMKDLPMLISAKDIRDVTGYGKEAIRNWINSEKILGAVVRKRFVVAKEDLIDFLCSPYYSNIIRKSKTHIEDLSNYILS